MKKIQVLSLILAVLCLAAWIVLRKPYSPSDDLPMVSYQAFDVKGIHPKEGDALAEDARKWTGVTAVTFNPESELLVLSYTNANSEQSLLHNIQQKASVPVTKKVFVQPAGPQCPVPMSLITAFPTYLFWTGTVLGLMFLISLLIGPFQKRYNFG